MVAVKPIDLLMLYQFLVSIVLKIQGFAKILSISSKIRKKKWKMLLLDRSYTFFVSNNNTLMGSKFGRAIFLKIIPRPTSLGSNLTNLSIGSYLVIGSTKAQLQATDGEAEAGRKRSVAVEDKSDSCAGLIYLIGCLVGGL
ncbi:hypothetical protein Tsubulata_003902 [Turnera subulata]|uniref:Uncharacterized protein n=1 Tax=Turnera subulata TaxID=218843 RepID=A0A9Q0GKQ1_9ROSI|nr:hypothetical protein Tsubulata_003902 [Turnera subulata]